MENENYEDTANRTADKAKRVYDLITDNFILTNVDDNNQFTVSTYFLNNSLAYFQPK